MELGRIKNAIRDFEFFLLSSFLIAYSGLHLIQLLKEVSECVEDT